MSKEKDPMGWLDKSFNKDITVVIWDDQSEEKEKKFFDYLAKGLRGRGWKVIVTTDKQKTIDIACKGQCDVVVLDLMENEKKVGLDMLKAIRSKKAFLPVVMFSVKTELSDIKGAIRGEVSYYLPRPIDNYHELIRAIEVAIETERTKEKMMNERYYTSVGHLAAGVAHFIKNALWNIGSRAQYMLSKTDKNNEFYELLDTMGRRCDDANKVVIELLNFARRKELKPKKKEVNIIELIHDVLDLLSHECKYFNINVSEKITADKIILLGDEFNLKEVFLNLIKNAIEAMQDGGKLTATVSSKDDRIIISIEDTGEGMDADTMESLFIPFYTTKPTAVGFGLFESHRIIKEHGGIIQVESRKGEGSTFTVELPAKGKP